MKKIFEREGAFKIILFQRRNGSFLLRYGTEERSGEYTDIAHALGESLLHSLACEGSINTEKVRIAT